MSTATKPSRVVFPNHEALYKNYRAPQKHIFYNGDTYEFRKVVKRANANIHVYRCRKEMHTLKIYMGKYFPLFIEGVYSTEEVV
ncbi:MAG: hypothetical protein RR595_13780 [Lysinibacillus sp.]